MSMENEEDKSYSVQVSKELSPNFDDEGIDADASPDGDSSKRVIQSWAKKMVKRNSEAVGWIKIPDWNDDQGNPYIDFPVLQHVSNDTDVGNNYYLHKNIDKKYYYPGSIYADCISPINEKGQPDNITIYGHHLRKMGMAFTHLAEYKQGVDFLKKHPVIEFNTIYESHQKYVIIGCYIANPEKSQDLSLIHI